MSKYGDVIRQARKQENQKTGKPENRKTSAPLAKSAASSTLDSLQSGTLTREEQTLDKATDGFTSAESTPAVSAVDAQQTTEALNHIKAKTVSRQGRAEQMQTGVQALRQQTSERVTDRSEEVNLSIKVPKALRRHWVVEAKRQDTTLTAAIMSALKDRFGEPEES